MDSEVSYQGGQSAELNDCLDSTCSMSKRPLLPGTEWQRCLPTLVPIRLSMYIALFWVTTTQGFAPGFYAPSRSSLFHTLHQALHSSNAETDEVFVEEALSDVDSRVLRSLLQEKKLNLDTEEDVRKLLERGTVKTVPKPVSKEEDESSEFSSTIIKTLTDTKLWKKISAQAEMTLESVGLWVSNKIEQDVKVLAALGLFAWDRVTRDVARALPAASSAAQSQLFLLANRSSYIAAVIDFKNETKPRDVRDELNRPQDEIQSVTRELFAILSGERTRYMPGSSQRGLRSLAPAGTVNSAERQRRALQRKQEAAAKRKNVAQLGGRVVDTAWELRRELKAESNVPGYKTEPIRSAIAAGVTATGNLLSGVRERARLSAVEQKELFLKSQASIEKDQADDVSVVDLEREPEPVSQEVRFDPEKQEARGFVTKRFLDDIRVERRRIVDRLTACIDQPDATWLTREVVESLENLDFISSPAMQDCFTKMILLRDEIDNPVHDVSVLDDSVNDLISLRTAIDYLCSYTASEVSDVIAEEIRMELYSGRNEFDDEPLIVRLEEELELLQASLTTAQATTSGTAAPEVFDVIPDAVFIDVIPDAFMMDSHERLDGMDEDGVGAGMMAEIVSDDDFESAVSAAKKVFDVPADETEKQQPNLLFIVVLRSLDVVFFIAEKTVTVVIPGTIVVFQTAWTRVEELNRSGLGSEGWKKLANLAEAKGRY